MCVNHFDVHCDIRSLNLKKFRIRVKELRQLHFIKNLSDIYCFCLIFTSLDSWYTCLLKFKVLTVITVIKKKRLKSTRTIKLLKQKEIDNKYCKLKLCTYIASFFNQNMLTLFHIHVYIKKRQKTKNIIKCTCLAL